MHPISANTPEWIIAELNKSLHKKREAENMPKTTIKTLLARIEKLEKEVEQLKNERKS